MLGPIDERLLLLAICVLLAGSPGMYLAPEQPVQIIYEATSTL